MPSLTERLVAIGSDRDRGAAELARAAAETLQWAAGQPGFSEAALREAGEALIRAQPAMAPLHHLVQAVVAGGAARVAETCAQFLERLEREGAAVACQAAEMIRDGMTVMTHSRSSTVLRALLEAWRSGRRFEVIATESRPRREGVTLARELGGAGIPVRLIVDAAACSLMAQTGLVLVGADAVSPQGVVNKIGTTVLALAARRAGVPMYVLATFDKFLPADRPALGRELRDPAEVLAQPGAGVTPVNFYFELTPLELFSGILSGSRQAGGG